MTNGEKKASLVLRTIACELLGMNVGDRMEPVFSMSARLQVSNGTVQNALRSLEEQKVLSLAVHGHRGSFIESIDYAKLLTFAQINGVFFAMPIPYSRRYEGMASGFRQELGRLGLDNTGIFFISGSGCRLTALFEDRVEGIVMSAPAARHYIDEGYPLDILYKFPYGSYINNHYLITRRGFDLDSCTSIRVGIDEKSYDQMTWSSICFSGKQVENVPVHYMHVLDHIKSGFIDAAVWSFEDTYFDESLSCKELHSPELDENTAAVLVCQKDNIGMIHYLRRNICFEEISRIQNAVLDGSMLPDY